MYTINKKNNPLSFIILLFVATSCGVNAALIRNQNQNTTHVHLGSKNYKVLERVDGKSTVSYVLLFGGVNKKQLYSNAYSEMVKAANLDGSKALINVVSEEHVGGVPPFYYKRTITVSAQVIEFTN